MSSCQSPRAVASALVDFSSGSSSSSSRHFNQPSHLHEQSSDGRNTRSGGSSSIASLTTSNRRLAVLEGWLTPGHRAASASRASPAVSADSAWLIQDNVTAEPALTLNDTSAAAGCYAPDSSGTDPRPAAAPWRFSKVSIHTLEHIDPPNVVTSQQIMERLDGLVSLGIINPGSLEQETGIRERRMWPLGTTVVQVATWAARKVLDASGVDPGRVGVICSTSVARDNLEPSAAVCVQHALGLSPSCLNLDVTNACVGMMNGMLVVAGMIEAGVCEYGLVVCAENHQDLVEATIQRLSSEPIPADLRQQLPTLTVGCGAVAMLLCRSDLAPPGANHRLTGAMALARPEHCNLCRLADHKMLTDASAMLLAGRRMAQLGWPAVQKVLGWSASNIDLLVPHQVSKKVHETFSADWGVNPGKVVATYPQLGNVAAAGVFVALSTAVKQGRLQPGKRVALVGLGSGMNYVMADVIW